MSVKQNKKQQQAEKPGITDALHSSAKSLLGSIYPGHDAERLARSAIDAFWPGQHNPLKAPRPITEPLWDESDSYLITYGNSFIDGEHKPLDLLNDFLTRFLKGSTSGVHILPYFPYTSDDGFAITDYYKVNSTLGDWEDIERISDNFRLMSDIVINHCSSQSRMFSDYLQGHKPYDSFFLEASPEDDLSIVVRPRAHDLLREVSTSTGTKHVWCTFSHDQVDFDFRNPEVLFEFLRILRAHIDHGVRTIRLDAVAFLWKQVGTNCIHLKQTHDVVRFIRLMCDFNAADVLIITETNVPNAENLSYFGNRNEAHAVYNFSLPPLLVHALLNGTSKHLNAWQMSMPPAQVGCFYFNFTASHDGIGLRPAEGLLSPEEIDQMIETVTGFGGLVSMREGNDGKQHPYEINVALYDALEGTSAGRDDWQMERFLCSQVIAFGLEGVPGIYIHSLLGTHNDHEGVEKTGHNRAINRHRWQYPELLALLDDPASHHSIVLAAMKSLLAKRSRQPAFHPNATQFTLQLGESLFGFWRQSMDRSQSVFAIHNLSNQAVSVPRLSLNLIGGEHWHDLIAEETVEDNQTDIAFAPYQCRWITNQPL